jgi:HK97 family phage major capsid protein
VARDVFESWIPDELGSKPIVAFQQSSAVDAVGHHEPMLSDTKRVPRDGGFTVTNVTKGSAYGESTSTQDYVELIARKIGGVERVAEEDLADSSVDILETKRVGAATAMAKFFDNATLGVTAASNGTTIPYTSVYRALTQDDTAVGYTGNANLTQTGGALTYEDIVATVGFVEASEFADESRVGWLAHPAFKGYLRGLVDLEGQPLWKDNQSGIAGGIPGTLLGYPVKWSRGARMHATATGTPTGHPLAFFGDFGSLIVGDAKLAGLPTGQMGTQLQRADTGVGFLTDETLMKAAMRKGFAVGNIATFACIEKS